MKDNDSIFLTHFIDQFEGAVLQGKDYMDLAIDLHKKDGGNIESSTVKFFDTHFGQRYRYLIESPIGFPRLTQRCEHIDIRHPSVMFSNISKPNHIFCMECFIEEEKEQITTYASRCNGCFLDGYNTFYSFQVQIGFMLVAGHLCEACKKLQRETS
jgi:hypothetical protein